MLSTHYAGWKGLRSRHGVGFILSNSSKMLPISMLYILGRQQAYLFHTYILGRQQAIYLEEGNWAREVEEAHIPTLVKDQPLTISTSILYILCRQHAYLFHHIYIIHFRLQTSISMWYIYPSPICFIHTKTYRKQDTDHLLPPFLSYLQSPAAQAIWTHYDLKE